MPEINLNPRPETSYELYRRGLDLLVRGDFAAAAGPLGKGGARVP